MFGLVPTKKKEYFVVLRLLQKTDLVTGQHYMHPDPMFPIVRDYSVLADLMLEQRWYTDWQYWLVRMSECKKEGSGFVVKVSSVVPKLLCKVLRLQQG